MEQLKHKIYFISIHPTFIGEGILRSNFKGLVRSSQEALVIESINAGISKYTSYSSLEKLVCKKYCVNNFDDFVMRKYYKLSSIGLCEDVFGISQYLDCKNFYIVPWILTSTSLEYICRMSEFALDFKIDRYIKEKHADLYRSVRQKVIMSMFR